MAQGMVACGAAPVTVVGNTAAGQNRVGSYRGCTDLPQPGREIAYAFTPDCAGPMTVSLVGHAGADLDLFVLEGACRGDGEHCVGYSAGGGEEEVTFSAEAGVTYYLVVDSFRAVPGAFSLVVDCGCGEPTSLTCATPGLLGCGEAVDGDTSLARNRLQDYACTFLSESGAEDVYTLDLPTGAAGNLRVTGIEGDVDLFLLEVTPGEGCGAAACVAFSAGFADESIDFVALAGASYYAVVDGYGGGEGAYTLGLACCQPDCSQAECGPDPVCGALDCGGCGAGTFCEGGTCVEERCSGIGFEGCCFENQAVWCEDGHLVSDDCSLQPSCGWSATFEGYICGTGGGADPSERFPLDCPPCAPLRSCEDYGFDCGAHPECPTLSCGGCEGEEVCDDGHCAPPLHLCDHVLGSLSCASPTIAGDTGGDTTDSLVDAYSCQPWTESGPEDVYRFLAPADGTYTFALSHLDLGADLDLWVLGTDCRPASCLAHGDWDLSLSATGGSTYYLVVDGYQGSSSNYVLELGCP